MGSSRTGLTAVDVSRPDGGDPVLASQFAALAKPLLPDAASAISSKLDRILARLEKIEQQISRLHAAEKPNNE